MGERGRLVAMKSYHEKEKDCEYSKLCQDLLG